MRFLTLIIICTSLFSCRQNINHTEGPSAKVNLDSLKNDFENRSKEKNKELGVLKFEQKGPYPTVHMVYTGVKDSAGVIDFLNKYESVHGIEWNYRIYDNAKAVMPYLGKSTLSDLDRKKLNKHLLYVQNFGESYLGLYPFK